MKSSAFQGYLTEDVIAAEASPPGRGGVSVIRISGKSAFTVALRVFSPGPPLAGRFRVGLIHAVDVEGAPIDEALALSFKEPNSYTGENVVEFNLHGSPVLVARTLEELYKAGARPAAPGEFTCRAFLNGRMDLTQAEAVADLISAGSRQAAEQALRQIRGSLKDGANFTADIIKQLLAAVEMEMDFSEEDEEFLSSWEKKNLLVQAEGILKGLIKDYRNARCLREGVDIAIIGAPNVGKSSLFNALIGEKRAIVHATPGTTRDAVTESVYIKGIEFRLIDTAGLRVGEGEIEDEGIGRALEAARKADLVIMVRSVDLPKTPPRLETVSAPVIRVMNKIDLTPGANLVSASEAKQSLGLLHKPAADFQRQDQAEIITDEIQISTIRNQGLDDLRLRMYQAVGGSDYLGWGVVNRERQLNAAKAALITVQEATEYCNRGMTADILAESLRAALEELDALTGKRRLEGLIEEVFSRFCVGK